MQSIVCSVTINSAIDRNSVELTWRSNDSIITADNRVTITPTNITESPSSFTYTTTIQFAYLVEGDEGNYTCNVIVDDMIESHSIILQNLLSMLYLNINIHACILLCYIHTCLCLYYHIMDYFHEVQIFMNTELLALAEIFMIHKFTLLSSLNHYFVKIYGSFVVCVTQLHTYVATTHDRNLHCRVG